MFKKNSLLAGLIHKILFLPLKNKSHIFALPYNYCLRTVEARYFKLSGETKSNSK